VVQEIVRFLKADTAFMNLRPLRYSLVLDPHPDTLPHVPAAITKRHLKLRDAVLSSFHQNEVGIRDSFGSFVMNNNLLKMIKSQGSFLLLL